MSRTKWALNGPVPATPGTIAYQSAGATSMISPLAARPMPRTQATKPRISSLLPPRRGSLVPCDIGIENRRRVTARQAAGLRAARKCSGEQSSPGPPPPRDDREQYRKGKRRSDEHDARIEAAAGPID